MQNEMQRAMESQADELRRMESDTGVVIPMAERLANRRVIVIGTGTSWHAAAQGAMLLRRAHVDAWAMSSVDFALDGPAVARGDVVIAMTHTGSKRFAVAALARAHDRGAETLVISGIGAVGADLETVAREKSAAYTVSHLGALFRLAQLATAAGADLGDLAAVPDNVEHSLSSGSLGVDPPRRLLEFIGGGINQWTAAEGALKVRETAYIASEGLGIEQFLHGPSVALRDGDTLICLDGGGPWSDRLSEVATAAERSGVKVVILRASGLSEPLSIFPLTVMVQRIALESAAKLGTNPDSFGRDVVGREAWADINL